jgi:Tol biopolymer transport system component
VFVRDWVAGTTERANVSSVGAEANHETYRGSISGDGRRVAFRSEASNLVPHDTNNAQDVFVHDRRTNTTTRVSVSTRGSQAYAPPSRQTAPGHSFVSRAFLSQTGRFAAFGSYAANLVTGDTNKATDVFVRDLKLRRTVRVSVGPAGAQANGNSFVMGISGDGSVVLFVSSANNLVPGDTNGQRDAFVRIRPFCAAR